MVYVGAVSYKRWKSVPCPKGDHEAEPREEEDPAICVYRVEDGQGTSLPVDWVDYGSSDQVREGEFQSHLEQTFAKGANSIGNRKILKNGMRTPVTKGSICLFASTLSKRPSTLQQRTNLGYMSGVLTGLYHVSNGSPPLHASPEKTKTVGQATEPFPRAQPRVRGRPDSRKFNLESLTTLLGTGNSPIT